MNYDIRNDVYNIENFNMDDFVYFHNSHMNNNARVVMILDPQSRLERFGGTGQIHELTLEDIFGY